MKRILFLVATTSLLLLCLDAQSQMLGKVIDRKEWGGHDVVAGDANQYKRQPVNNGKMEIKYISIHHTESRSFHERWKEHELLRFVQEYHQGGKTYSGKPIQFRDIAYHYIVGKSGKVYKGRSDDRAPASFTHYLSEEEMKGATYKSGIIVPRGPVGKESPGYSGGHITVSFLHGKGDDAEEIFDSNVMDSAGTLIAELLIKYGLEPKDIRTHREIASGNTNCPGDAIYRWIRGPLMSPMGIGPGMKRIVQEFKRLSGQ